MGIGKPPKNITKKQWPLDIFTKKLTRSTKNLHTSNYRKITDDDEEEKYKNRSHDDIGKGASGHQWKLNINPLTKSKTENQRIKRIEGILSINSLIKNRRE